MISTDQEHELSGYAICTMGRSGSNYLCQLLGSTGIMGTPKEYFNTVACRRRGEPDYPAAPLAQIDWILKRSITPNGIYGLKVFPHQIDTVVPLRWADHLPSLRFISLIRDDVLDQAISFSRAQQTGQWRSSDAERKRPQYDTADILHQLKFVVRSEARWRLFFARNGLDPLRLHYETILDDPQAAIDKIAHYLGIREPATIQWSEVSVAVQRDEQNLIWRQRFLKEMADPNIVDRTMNETGTTTRRFKAALLHFLNRLRKAPPQSGEREAR